MRGKKFIWIGALIIIVIAIVAIIIDTNSGKREAITNNTALGKTNAIGNNREETNTINQKIVEKLPATIEQATDGVIYKIENKEIEPEIILKDNYFDTQIRDININFDQYEGKTIQIEGLYFLNKPYTFVGRYSLSNLCPTCPAGYSYFEYEWKGDKKIELKDEESWIRVIGILSKGNDGQEYYYIDATSIEIMNEKGQDTVNN